MLKHLTVCLILAMAILIGCSKREISKTETINNVSLNGFVEKGPFVRGTNVVIYELDDSLNQTGKSFSTSISDDKGSFSLTDLSLKSKYIAYVVQSGYYFNELTGQLTSSPLSLSGFCALNNDSRLNINILGQLEEKRVRYLMKTNKMSIATAKKQADAEIYKAFRISSTPELNSEEMSLIGNNGSASVLLGISSAMLNLANSDNATLVEYLSKISSDFQDDGILVDSISNRVLNAIQNLDTATICENVRKRYKDLGINMPDINLNNTFSVQINGIIHASDTLELHLKEMYNGFLSQSLNAVEKYFLLEGLYSNTTNGPGTSSDLNALYNHKVYSNNTVVDGLFSAVYKAIAAGNGVLEVSATATKDSSHIYQYLAYPYLAYQYWAIMNIWGDPFYVTPSNRQAAMNGLPRSTKNVVSDSLIIQLQSSIDVLNSIGNRKELDLARAMIGKLALDNGDYLTARAYLDTLIYVNSHYRLATKDRINNSGDESIYGYDYGLYPNPDISNPDLYVKGTYRNIVRYTEVLLLESEIYLHLNHLSNAINYLNQVRSRNGETQVPANSTPTDILNYLASEYKTDLKNEGLYFAFSKRNNLSQNLLGLQQYQNLLPIPLTEIMLNPKAQQNPGY